MKLGDVVDGTIELKNIGTDPWKAGVTKLAPTPRDKNSPLGATGWLSPTRISSPPADVAPGASYKFPVKLTANKIGDYVQTFGVVEEGVTWFSDAGQGGPADDFLKVHVVVVQNVGGDGGVGDGGPIADGGGGDGGTGGNDLTGSDDKGGCGCRVAGEPSGGSGEAATFALFAAALGVTWTRRRRTRD
jgi:MYXO-CTERM domain-containing protein